MAILGLDAGDVRVGVAISRSGVIAEPLITLQRRGRKQILNEIEALVNEHGVTICVIGLPYLESGLEGEQAEKTRAFGRSLARRMPSLTIEFEDERHSSADARELAGSRRLEKSAQGLTDRLAAAIILQAWLDRRAAAKDIKDSQ